MGFQIGDKVIHWTYGLGEIVQIEEKVIHDQMTNCYVVRTHDLMIWIPINDLQQLNLRVPASPDEFVKLFSILTGPGDVLPEDRVIRKNQILAQMRDGHLESICRVVRDLTLFKHSAKLNDNEKSLLERAINTLLTEWTFSLGVPLSQAQETMAELLGE